MIRRTGAHLTRSTRAAGALVLDATWDATAEPHEAVAALLVALAALSLGHLKKQIVATTLRSRLKRPSWGALTEVLQEAQAQLGGGLYVAAAKAVTTLNGTDAAARRLVGLLGPDAWHEGEVEGETLGAVYESLRTLRIVADAGGTLRIESSTARRRSGSHYTPRALADEVARRALGPLLGASRVWDLRVCDPAVGGGAFVLATCRALASLSGGGDHALRRVAESCVRAVDADPLAIEVTREAVWVETGARLDASFIVVGDSLLDESVAWPATFPDVFLRREKPGFDAIVGNPPWISYAGRAAQPLDPEKRRVFEDRYASFAGFRNLQALFIERCAALLAPGGRLGLLIPSSMSEQIGYAPSRAAHDRACVCDEDLPDYGESFEGVVQPCMALLSTRRAQVTTATGERWPVARPDLDDVARSILRKMSGPCLPPTLFGERGLQSSGSDLLHLPRVRDARHTVPIRAGADIQAFRLGAPSRFADPAWFGRRLRPAAQFADAKLLIRQTARVPTACLSDGAAFRNSIVAGFQDALHPASVMLAYLNSAPLRFLHYFTNRDARQGLPQVKIGHLRALPELPSAALTAALDRLGAPLAEHNRAPTAEESAEIDALVAEGFGLDTVELARISQWHDTPR